jgi:putative ABC transport system permease protein
LKPTAKIKRRAAAEEHAAISLIDLGNCSISLTGGDMQTLWQDLRYGARMLRKKPGFTLIAVITLALGIGANTAIFSLVNMALLRPLPVERPEQLVSINNVSLNLPVISYPNYRDFRDRNNVFSGMLAYRYTPFGLSVNGVNERVWGYLATGDYFELLGVKPALGRFFTPEDDKAPGAHPVAVLTYDCWQKRFAGDPQAVGKTVIVNGRNFTIIGVAPQGFYGSEIIYRPEIWFPSIMQTQIENWSSLETRGAAGFFVQGRLKPGVTMSQAEAGLKTIAAQLAGEFPKENEGMAVTLSPAGLLGARMRGPVIGFAGVLMAVVGLVLLLACANLANLLLARATERHKEIAVRMAIGASRWRLVRQLLTESILLAASGAALGLLMAYWLVDAIMAFKPPIDVGLSTELRIDGRVLLFTLIVSALTGVVFGLLPALQATKPDLAPALKNEVSLGAYRRSWLRNWLVVLQVSLSLLLLICAGLVLRGLQRAQSLNPGLTPQRALELSFDLSLQGYDGPRTQEFKQRLLERVRALPGVQYAGLSNLVPLSLRAGGNPIYVEGQPEQRGMNVPSAMISSASPGFLSALGTRLLQGRDFTEQDGSSNQVVAMVNETFARRFWPGQSALGKRFSQSSPAGPWTEVVGVIEDGKYFSLSEEATSFIYTNLSPQSGGYLTLVVRTASEPQSAMAAIRHEFQQLDATLPLYNVKTMVEHMDLPLFPARVAATLLGCFGSLALALAAIGIFGVMAYAVAQRTREIGIRMALGAQAGGIFKLVVGQGLKLTALGMCIGLACALAGTRLMSGLLYGVSALDVVTFAGVSLLLALVALLACYIPARRAAKVDPIVALRRE